MNQEERVVELVLKLRQMAQEAFVQECEATDQVRNMAVLASALVRAGVGVMVTFCPREKLAEGMNSLRYQFTWGLGLELNSPPEEGAKEVLKWALAANEDSVAGQVEGEIGEPQNQPEK